MRKRAKYPRVKYALIWFLDWIVDVHLLKHSVPLYCRWLAEHPWWESKNPCQHPGNWETTDRGWVCSDCGRLASKIDHERRGWLDVNRARHGDEP